MHIVFSSLNPFEIKASCKHWRDKHFPESLILWSKPLTTPPKSNMVIFAWTFLLAAIQSLAWHPTGLPSPQPLIAIYIRWTKNLHQLKWDPRHSLNFSYYHNPDIWNLFQMIPATATPIVSLLTQIIFTLQGIFLDFRAWGLSLKSEVLLQRVGKKTREQKIQWRAGVSGEKSFRPKKRPHPLLSIFSRK